MVPLRRTQRQKGFTLVELLIVIAILAILAAVVFVGIDPTARFEDTRNAKRSTDLNNILSALKLNQVDNKGAFIEALSDKPEGAAYMIGTNPNDCTTSCTTPIITTSPNCVDLSGLVKPAGSRGGYLPSVPFDPSTGNEPLGTASMTGYYVMKNTNKTLTIGACHTELGTNNSEPDLSVTR